MGGLPTICFSNNSWTQKLITPSLAPAQTAKETSICTNFGCVFRTLQAAKRHSSTRPKKWWPRDGPRQPVKPTKNKRKTMDADRLGRCIPRTEQSPAMRRRKLSSRSCVHGCWPEPISTDHRITSYGVARPAPTNTAVQNGLAEGGRNLIVDAFFEIDFNEKDQVAR